MPTAHRSCKYTRGGFLRADLVKKARKAQALPSVPSSVSSRQSQPEPELYVKKKQFDALGREKRINPVLVNHYSEVLFASHMQNASNDNVRSMYTRSNNAAIRLPSMGDFMREQGVDLDSFQRELDYEEQVLYTE